ncbi:MAG: nitrite reductase large subunit NirB [Aggregatilineales bacterium]
MIADLIRGGLPKKTIVVVGNGMVGHKFLDLLIRRGVAQRFRLVTFSEEPRVAYDRVNLSGYFSGKSAGDLSLVPQGLYEDNGIEIYVGDRVVAIDRARQCVISANGVCVEYDSLVLATGSYPFVPPIKGKEIPGTFVYRTLEDLDAIRAYAATARIGVVVGGGLLGLECANALKSLALDTHVVEFAPRLMTVQVDDLGGALLRQKIEALGVHVHTGKSTTEIVSREDRVAGMRFADGSELETDLIVFSAGIRPRDELARVGGLALGERGGIQIDEQCRTSDPHIYAIGECAAYQNRTYGLVAPGYTMAGIVADALTDSGASSRFTGADMSTKLKLMGVDVASFGDAFGTTPDAKAVSIFDALAGSYKKLTISADGKRILGGILVGDASSYGALHQMMLSGMALPPHPEDLLLPPRAVEAGQKALGIDAFPDSTRICTCENIDKGTICGAIRAQNLTTIPEVKRCTKAGTGCGGCVPMLTDILKSEMKRTGKKVANHLCEHFPYSRQELFHLIRVHEIKSFDELLSRHGHGMGCEICKPAVASILASTWNEHILEPAHAALQDTNDYFMANMQRDGSYSVVPRIPGGEITPDKLIVIGQVAQEFNLYVKITGGQRIDMFGARVDQLPHIWKRLVDAGFESGHAYGKALRTVKSCVGTTWCRYGQQDSVGLAIKLEDRYKGLRAPHKVKAAVSGCTRECAEAQSKDFGVIATEKGYNLYLCGNGGMKPQHGLLFAQDLTEAQVIQNVDRFLMFYIRTADRLQRTASWLNNLEGGIEYLRQVIIDDSLGIAAELEADMARTLDAYRCEWKATLEDPEKLRRFRHFVNTDQPDPSLVYVEERGQKRPAFAHEK